MDKKRITKIILIIITILTLLSLFSWSFAASSEGQQAASWLSNLLKWSIRLTGILAFLILIAGGFRYMTAAGSVLRMKAAKKQIISGLSGVIIVLVSFLLLKTINPQILQGIPKVPAAPVQTAPAPQPIVNNHTPYQYQEIPFGTILETRILAKNISCFDKSHHLIGCHSGQPISQEEKQDIAQRLQEDYPEQWPNAQPKDAEIAYQCFAFDKKGDPIDADPQRPGIQPMTDHDRLDCLEQINKALQAKSKFLKDRTKELAQLSDQCACGYCGCGACPCPPKGTCNCGGLCGGDPCPGRARMKQIREQLEKDGGCGLFMNQTIEGHNCLHDDELVKVDIDHYEDLTVVNQIRYLAYHFLTVDVDSLKTDLSYLEKAENTYKDQCQYGTVISHASLYDLKAGGEESTETKFCLNNKKAQWGETCPADEQLDITKYCREFNCQDCQKNGKKLACRQCDLNKLKQGKPIKYRWNNKEQTSYQCSHYLINNEKGEDKVKPTDKMGIMCKITPKASAPGKSDRDRQCYAYDEDALTLYCPKPDSTKAYQLWSRTFTSEGIIDPRTAHGFPIGTIELGQLVDNAEAYIKELNGELNDVIKVSTPNIVCPSYDKNDPNNQCKLFHLPPRCLCNVGVITTQGRAGCGPGCYTTHGCRCNDCGGCPGCPCSTCNAPSLEMDPCPLSVIFKRRDETKYWYDTDAKAVKPKTDHIINLIEAKNLKKTDYDRRELLAQLRDSTLKLEKCIPGYGKVNKGAMTAVDLNSCLRVLDRMKLQQLSIFPEFDSCYPYNSPTLTDKQQKACAKSRSSAECQRAVKDLMQDFFCIEENKTTE